MARLGASMRKMKDSGIEWIGQIPNDWNVKKCKYVTEFINGFPFESEALKDEYLYPVVRISDIKDGAVSFDSCLGVDNNSGLSSFLVKRNDILLAMSGATVGKVGIVRNDCAPAYINQRVGIIRTKCPNFLFYCLSTNIFIEYVILISAGTAQPNVSTKGFGEFPVPFPPLDEQKKIADFLDEKCGEIDSIRSDIQKQIDILNDYKKSVITEAVTKGLNPKAKLKDSGIEWIGKIPEGWVTRRLKELGKVRNGLTYSPTDICDPDEGYLVLRSSNIKDGKLSFEDNVFVSCRIPHELIVQKGDILICSRNGSRKLIGKNAIIDDVGNGRVTYGAFMMVFRTKYTKYLYYILNSGIFSYYLGSFFTSTINQLTGFDFGNMVVPFCTDGDEQKAIADYLDEKCSEIDATIADKQKQLETLDEYKKSLIFEYVTGKKECV